jgi:hypothetical protein
MMRFRKGWLAKINIAFTNRITSLFAGWLPSFGILSHVGRKSGKVYPDSCERLSTLEQLRHRSDLQQPIPLGQECTRGGRLRTQNSRTKISAFAAECRVRSYAAAIPDPARFVLKSVGADEYMVLSLIS